MWYSSNPSNVKGLAVCRLGLVFLICIAGGLPVQGIAQEAGQPSDASSGRKYVPRNLPEVVLRKKEAFRKGIQTGKQRIAFSTDPLFLLLIQGPSLGVYYTVGEVTLFAYMCYSTPGAPIFQGDAVYFHLPANFILSMQGEEYILLVQEDRFTVTQNSMIIEGGVIRGTVADMIDDVATKLFFRIGKVGGVAKRYTSGPDSVELYPLDVAFGELALSLLVGGRIARFGDRPTLYGAIESGWGVGLFRSRSRFWWGEQVETSLVMDLILRIQIGFAF